MKLSLLFLSFSLMFAGLGSLLSGTTSAIFQMLFALSCTVTALSVLRRRKIRKPVPSSFAATFRSDNPAPVPPGAPL